MAVRDLGETRPSSLPQALCLVTWHGEGQRGRDADQSTPIPNQNPPATTAIHSGIDNISKSASFAQDIFLSFAS